MDTKVLLGQYFTTNVGLQNDIRDLILLNPFDPSQIKCLEPSCGAGHLVALLESMHYEHIVAIEKDSTIEPICSTPIRYHSFHDANQTLHEFDLIVGNPPYVKYSMVDAGDLPNNSLISSGNLYLYFIEKAVHLLVDGGVFVFVLPKECLISSRGSELRKFMFSNGTITHYYDYQEARVFEDATPQIIIIRYQKNNFSHKTVYVDKTCKQNDKQEEYIESLENGKYVFKISASIPTTVVNDHYSVCVGLVSGCNKVFRLANEIVSGWSLDELDACVIQVLCSDGNRHPHLYVDSFSIEYIKNHFNNVWQYLQLCEPVLRARKIVKITEKNWYKWGAIRNLKRMEQPKSCQYIYVRNKSRLTSPFWIGNSGYYDGSILALCPKNHTVNLESHLENLNNQDDEYRRRSLLTNTKYSFTQGSLVDVPLSKSM